MRVIMYMASTVNGLIARSDDSTDFVTEAEWKAWDELSMECGNVIIGRKTYEVLCKEGKFPLPGRINIVISKNLPSAKGSDVVFAHSPIEALHYLREKGIEDAFVAGGAALNSSLLKLGIVHELYVDIEPRLIGKGVPFLNDDLDVELELLGVRKLSDNEVQLHYKIPRKSLEQ